MLSLTMLSTTKSEGKISKTRLNRTKSQGNQRPCIVLSSGTQLGPFPAFLVPEVTGKARIAYRRSVTPLTETEKNDRRNNQVNEFKLKLKVAKMVYWLKRLLKSLDTEQGYLIRGYNQISYLVKSHEIGLG
jgi:hypothetical protein